MRLMVRIGLAQFLLAASGVLAVAGPAQGQLARQRQPPPDAPKLLVVPFGYSDRSDSALALLVADGMRERFRTAHMRFNTITRQNMNENLVASGFPTDAPLEPSVVRSLARFLNARYVVEGRVSRNGDSVVVGARLYEAAGQTPQSANVVVATTPQRVGSGTGSDGANRLADAYESFDDVVECNRAREQGNLTRALQRANNALRRYPNSAGAYLCIASVLEAQNNPVDTVIVALRNAFDRDTVNTAVMRRLAARYEAVGDTTRLIEMLRRVLAIDVRDNEQRIATVQLLVRMGRSQEAVAVVDEGLVSNPASLELLRTRAIALAAAGRWADAAGTLQQVYDIDSSSLDTTFALRITTYYRQAGDSASLYRWLQIVTRRLPGEAEYWYDLSNVAMNRGDTTRAIEAAQRYVRTRPDDLRGRLALARALLARGELDSALAHAEVAARDSALRPYVGPFYFQAGAQALRDTNFVLAARRLERARDWSNGQLRVTSSFYLAVAQIQVAAAADRAAEAARDCDAARANLQLLNEVEQNIIAGVSQDREQANQFLTAYIPSLRQRAEAFLRNWRCPPAASPSPVR